MSFGQEWWGAVALFSVAALWLLYRFANQKSWNSLAQFASAHLLAQLTANVSLSKRRIKQILTIVGIALCFLSLARPQWGFRWEETKRKGVDLLFAVDTSKSMLAQDVNPHRLARAKLAVLDLLEKLPGDRVGLIAFSGSAFLQCPLTLDYDAFRRSVEALDPTIIPKGGTDISAAIKEAETAFRLGSPTHKILILITDGEDLQAGGITSAQKAAENEVKIFTVGVGTSSGELIPVINAAGGTEFLKDDKGTVVKSRLDESTLRHIAEVTGGLYQPLGQKGEGLEWIYQHGLASLPKQELSSRMARIPLERFQWPLGIAIALLIIEFLMSDRRGDPQNRAGRKLLFWKSKSMPKAVLPLLLLAITTPAFASPQSAEKAYQKKNFDKAYQEYKSSSEKNPKKPELHFNTGSSAYRLNRFEDASAAFQRALQTDNIPVQQKAFYNLGNTQYRIGQKTEKTDVSHTIQTWQQALKSYESALSLKSDDADARYNYEFVKKKLEELQKKEEEKKEEEKKKEEQNKDQKKEEKDQKDQKDQQQQDAKNQEQSKPQSSEPKKEEEKDESQAKGNEGKEKEKAKPEEPRPLPGQMTQEEAKNLLDSMRDEEKKMPVAIESGKQGVEDVPVRDW